MRRRQRYSRLHRFSRNQGFTLPLIMGLGLLMIMIAVTLLLRTQTQQATSSSQKASESSIAIAEVGITRMQEFFGRYKGLTLENYPWAGASGRVLDTRSCTSSNAVYQAAEAFNSALSAGSGDGQFSIISYTRPNNPNTINSLSGVNGTLVLEGAARRGSETLSTTRLEVKIPIRRDTAPITADPPPFIWAGTITNAGTITGSSSSPVWRFRCSATALSTIVPTAGALLVDDPSKALFGSTPLPDIAAPGGTISLPGGASPPAFSDATGSPNGAFRGYENQTLILPRSTSLQAAASSGASSLELSSLAGLRQGAQIRVGTDTAIYTIGTITATTIPTGPASGATSITVASATGFALGDRIQIGTSATVHTISSISGSTINFSPGLPSAQINNAPVYLRRVPISPSLSSAQIAGTTVKEVANGSSNEYIYSASTITLNNNAPSRLIVTPGEKVSLYVSTSFNAGTYTGNPKIAHNCFDTSSPADGTPDGSTLVTGCKPTNFKLILTATSSGANAILSGDQTVDLFALTPKQNLTLNGSTSARGAVWVDTLSVSSGTSVLPPPTGTTLIWTDIQPNPPTAADRSFLPPTIEALSAWERQAIP